MGKSTKTTFVYTGHDNLEAMTGAIKYNNFLLKTVTDSATPTELKSKRILDFGAGSGTYADMLTQQGYKVDCVEPDKKLQNILRSKGYKVVSYAEDVNPNSYDIIYALNVMEHIEDDHQVFDQLAKALKKDSVIIVYVPAFQAIYTSMDKLVGHHRRYRKSQLREMAERNNLNIKKLHYVDVLGFAAAFVFRVFGNKDGSISAKSVRLYDSLVFPVSNALNPVTRRIAGKNALLIAQK